MSDNEKLRQAEDALAIKLLEAADSQVQWGDASKAHEFIAAYVALRGHRPGLPNSIMLSAAALKEAE